MILRQRGPGQKLAVLHSIENRYISDLTKEVPLELGTSPHEEKVVGALVTGLNLPPYALTVTRSPFPVAFNPVLTVTSF